jgi:plasmid stability protein
MSKTVQIRDVPEALHRKLKTRAAVAGLSLSDYLLAVLRPSVARPTSAQLLKRLQSRTRVAPPISPARAVRAERDSR